jgi:O-antigen/teichoic acid export membrane protein
VAVVCGWHCHRLRVFPARGAWGRPAWAEFKALFGYGKDVFVVQIGSLLIMASQPIIVSRSLGLEAVAAWSVGTKAFNLLGSLFWQGFDASTSVFSEMLVRGEQDRLRQRFTALVVVLQILCGVVAVVYAVGNSLFVSIWTHGRIAWPVGNDVLLGGWLLIAVLVHSNCGFVILTKQVQGMRYLFLIEGAVFVGLASLVTPAGGLPAMIGASLVCSLCFSGAYGVRRINQFFQFRFPAVERRWLGPLGQIGLVLLPVAAGAWWGTATWNSLSRLAVNAVIVGGLGGYLVLRRGLPPELHAEILQRTPQPLRRPLAKLICRGTTPA